MLSKYPFKEGLLPQSLRMFPADNLQLSAPSGCASAAERCFTQGHALVVGVSGHIQ